MKATGKIYHLYVYMKMKTDIMYMIYVISLISFKFPHCQSVIC